MAKIIGNTTATPNPRPDWNQTDETKADYIKNKPTDLATGQDVTNALAEAKSYTDSELAAFDFIKVMDGLPETGLPNKIYLVPKTDGQSQDLFDEYIYINKGTDEAPEYVWEWITTKQLEVDLTGYVEKIDGKGLSTEDFTTVEKNKLANIADNANNYILPAAGTDLGGVKSGNNVTITDGLITINDDGHNHIIDNIDGLQDELNERVLTGECVINTDAVYSKDTPSTSAPYAELSKIGGMTYKDGDTLKSAKVTEIESVGVNLFDESQISSATNSAGTASETYGVVQNGELIAKIGLYSYGITWKPFAMSLDAGTYTVSADCYIPTGGAPNPNLSVRLFNTKTNASVSASGVSLSSFDKWERISAQITLVEPSDYMLSVQGAGNAEMHSDMDVRFKNICVAEGNIAEYSPYKKKAFQIPEAVQTLDGYGEGLDSNNFNSVEWSEDGKRVFNRRVKTIELDGSEEWYIAGGTFWTHINDSKKSQGAVLSSRYTCTIIDVLYVSVASTGVSTVDEFKTLLNTEPLSITYILDTPIVTDLSDILSDDNFIDVEGNGTVTFKNEYEYDVPNEIKYYINSNSTISADTLVGDLIGTSFRAISDEYGNNIVATYATKDEIANAGAGDMLRSVYDTNNNGVVDNAEKLGGIAASSYALKSDISYPVASVNGKTGTVTLSTTDLGLTATTTELNYVDGVTSNVQTQLDTLSSDVENRMPLDNDGAIQIVSGDDLNNFKTPGIYICPSGSVAASLVNPPMTGSGFKLVVMAGYILERVTQYVTTNTNQTLYRKYTGSAWTSWATLYTTDNPPSAASITYGTLSSDRLPVVPIAKGGTGATTAEQARANLGIPNIQVYKSGHELSDSGNYVSINCGFCPDVVFFNFHTMEDEPTDAHHMWHCAGGAFGNTDNVLLRTTSTGFEINDDNNAWSSYMNGTIFTYTAVKFG